MKIKVIKILSIILLLMMSACSKEKEDPWQIPPGATYTFNPFTEGDLTTVDPVYVLAINDIQYSRYFHRPDNPRLVENPNDITVIVNHFHALSNDYEPDDLVYLTDYDIPVTTNNHRLRIEAAEALETMFKFAKEQGHTLIAASTYRSYTTQQNLYNNYSAVHGELRANTFSAKPGQSEHQLGLAVDISSSQFQGMITARIGNSLEGKWVQDNSHYFGYIVRYTAGKQHITGYIDEPWHLRYVGIELAKALYDCKCTLEEYYYSHTYYNIYQERLIQP